MRRWRGGTREREAAWVRTEGAQPHAFTQCVAVIEALIFDFDGVILDTETPDFGTWRDEFELHGVELERSLWSSFIGGGAGTFDVYAHLEGLLGRSVDRELVRVRRRRRYLEIVESSPLLPGVTDRMVQARELGLKVGVASSSNREWVEGHLVRRDLMRLVDSVRSRDDVSSVKPDPELFLASAGSMGVRPGACLAIEDSANGVTAATGAGMFCVVVTNPMTKDMALGHADLRLDALSDMPLAELLERAANSH